MVLPAASDPPLATRAGEYHEDPILHARARDEARVGAWATAGFGLASAAAVLLTTQRPLAVWLAVGLALASAALSAFRAMPRLSDRWAHRLPALAGANALLGAALFALPLVLGLTGRYVLFPLYFGVLTAGFGAAAFTLSLDARQAAMASSTQSERASERPTRARPGA